MPLLEYFGIVPKHFTTWCGYSLAAAAWGMWHVRLKAAATSQTSATLPHVPRQPASCAPHKTAESRRHVTVVIRLAGANSLRKTSFVIHGIPSLLNAMSSSALRTSMRMASRPQQRLASIQRQFSASAQQKKEIRDAYIISASRTPTAVVRPVAHRAIESSIDCDTV